MTHPDGLAPYFCAPFDCDVCGTEEHEYNVRTNVLGQDVCPDCEDKFRCDYCDEICPDSEYYHHKWQANFAHLGLNIIKTYSDHLCPDCYQWEIDPNREQNK